MDSLLTNPMEAEPLPEKHNPVLSGTGHNTQAFLLNPILRQPVPFSKKAYCSQEQGTYVRSRDQSPSSHVLLAYEMALIRSFPWAPDIPERA